MFIRRILKRPVKNTDIKAPQKYADLPVHLRNVVTHHNMELTGSRHWFNVLEDQVVFNKIAGKRAPAILDNADVFNFYDTMNRTLDNTDWDFVAEFTPEIVEALPDNMVMYTTPRIEDALYNAGITKEKTSDAPLLPINSYGFHDGSFCRNTAAIITERTNGTSPFQIILKKDLSAYKRAVHGVSVETYVRFLWKRSHVYSRMNSPQIRNHIHDLIQNNYQMIYGDNNFDIQLKERIEEYGKRKKEAAAN